MSHQIKAAFLLFILLAPIQSYAMDHKFNDLTIIVSSCDRYSELWPSFFKQLFKHWPSLNTTNKSIKIILTSNNITFPHDRVITFTSAASLGWSGNISEALRVVDTNYVLYLQDDYILTEDVDEDRLFEIFNSMKENNVTSIGIYKDDFFKICSQSWEHYKRQEYQL